MSDIQRHIKKSPIYGNYSVYSPDNILMFNCSEKKANWYLDRSLATIEGKNIKLNFSPNGLGHHNSDYGLNQMENKCVNCGGKENLNKHHVVPICYRKHFPLELKSHKFHDVLPLCINCHNKYERKADILKTELSIKYNAPINGIVKKGDNRHSRLSFVLLNKDLPTKRHLEIKSILKSELGIKRLTKSRLIKISINKESTTTKTHGEIVMSQINDYESFIIMWRKHFIDNNICKYLPKDWKINNGI